MLDFRSPLILGALPAGVLLASLAWFVAGGGSSAADDVTAVQERLDTALPVATTRAGFDSATQVLKSPLFALADGPVAEVAVRLDGLARSSRRIAALLSIGGKPAEWLALGESRDGVTLQNVLSNKALIETANGEREVMLGVPNAPGGASAAPLSAPSPIGPIPPGARLPPVPASAPAMGG